MNELTANTNGGRLTVMGTTTSPATNVTVNVTNVALLYNDATFAATNMPLTTTYTAIAKDSLGRRATNTVSVSIATNNGFQYDGNGNLTNDGLRSFAYDDENQLIQVLVPNQWKSQFAYDGKMRRRIRQEFTWQGGAWLQTNAVYYVYDGNLVIQERDLNNLPVTTYTRGKDLSGSLEGAGGIGGLLARTSQAYSDAPLSGESYYHSDANGNVTMLIDTAQGIVAKYLYDAFGNIISKSGLLADANVIRFSSKEADSPSGLIYYLYRYYDPNLQRWLNRDPIEEDGGINLYEFANNCPENWIDSDGQETITLTWPVIKAVPISAPVVTAYSGAVCVGWGLGWCLAQIGNMVCAAPPLTIQPITYPRSGPVNSAPIAVSTPVFDPTLFDPTLTMLLVDFTLPITLDTKCWHRESPNPVKTKNRDPRKNDPSGKRNPKRPPETPPPPKPLPPRRYPRY